MIETIEGHLNTMNKAHIMYRTQDQFRRVQCSHHHLRIRETHYQKQLKTFNNNLSKIKMRQKREIHLLSHSHPKLRNQNNLLNLNSPHCNKQKTNLISQAQNLSVLDQLEELLYLKKKLKNNVKAPIATTTMIFLIITI